MTKIKLVLTIIIVAILMLIWTTLEEIYRLVQTCIKGVKHLFSCESRKENYNGYD